LLRSKSCVLQIINGLDDLERVWGSTNTIKAATNDGNNNNPWESEVFFQQ
jgi:hypothetical protein